MNTHPTLTPEQLLLEFFDGDEFDMWVKDTLSSVSCATGLVNKKPVAVYCLESDQIKGAIGPQEANEIIALSEFARAKKMPIVSINAVLFPRMTAGVTGIEACERIIRMSGRVSQDLPQIAILTEEAAQNHGFLSTYADVIVVQDTANPQNGCDTGQIVESTLDGVMTRARSLVDLIPSTREELKESLTFSYDGGDREMSKEVLDALSRSGPYDVNLLVKNIVDEDSFIELDKNRGPAVVTGLGKLVHQTIGICASQTMTAAPIDDDALKKITEITRFCERFSVPLINLVDTTDETTQQTLLAGKQLRTVGNFSMSVRHGSEVFAARQTMSPCVSLVIRRCYGSGFLLTTSMRPHHVILALENAKFSRYDDELTAERAHTDGWIKKVIPPTQMIEQLVHWVRWSRSKRARVTDQLHRNDPMRYNLNLDNSSE